MRNCATAHKGDKNPSPVSLYERETPITLKLRKRKIGFHLPEIKIATAKMLVPNDFIGFFNVLRCQRTVHKQDGLIHSLKL